MKDQNETNFNNYLKLTNPILFNRIEMLKFLGKFNALSINVASEYSILNRQYKAQLN